MATMTKAQLVDENIRLRAALDKLEQQVPAAPKAPKASSTSVRARFCQAYCRKHSVRSVPPGVFETWLAQRQAS